MTKRTIEITLGLAIFFCLIVSYHKENGPNQLLIWYILTPGVLKFIVWPLLFFVSGRLVFGKYKDYTISFIKKRKSR